MTDSSKIKEKWETRGLISACECFSCMNKLDHRLMGNRVRILCRNQCEFKPLKGASGTRVVKIPDIEQEL